MAQQNIFDNDTFFEGYKSLRERKINANNLFEIPALFSLLPDVEGMRILDLGCGFGEHCKGFIEKGATEVVGIDISEKMLKIARVENSDPSITYIKMPIEELGTLTEKHQIAGGFDMVISSLVFHYIEDYSGVVKNVSSLIRTGGRFIFSQEHPLATCYSGGDRWTKDEQGRKLHLNLKDYGRERENASTWFVDNVKRYHRMFSTIINTLIEAGFEIEKIIEPIATEEILKEYPEYDDLFMKPDFLLVKAVKK